MNAPVHPASDDQVDSLKQPNQFPGGYGQGFSSQMESSVDQPDITQETLQSGKDGPLGCCLSYIKYSTVLASCYALYIMSHFLIIQLAGSHRKSRSCLQQEVLRTLLQATDSLDSPTTVGQSPEVDPGIPVA